jgi:ABC-2 type transport system ATP-binding protein
VEDALDVKVRLAADDKAPRYASSIDMSGGGIRLESDAPMKKGSWVWLEFGLPGSEEKIECLAEVRWVQSGDAEAGSRFLYGVNFFDIEDPDRRRLVKHLFAKHYGYEREEGLAISVRDLRKSYGRIEALKGVTFEVDRGEIFALLGPNGAGKTTLTRILSTLLRPSSGAATVLGLDVATRRREIRRVVGYMPQAYVLYDDLTAIENLRFFGRAYGLHGRRLADLIVEALAFTELAPRANDLFRTFSGGMRQRLSLACTLIHRPKVLFLDEPTAGVDLKLRKSFWDYFLQLADLGITIFVTTHQMDEVEYCHRVACIHNGRIVLDDSPENIRKLGAARVTLNVRGRCVEHVVQNYKSALPGLIRELGDDASRIDSIDIRESSLEEILRDQIMGEGPKC